MRLLLGLRALCLEQLNLTLEERNFLDFAIEHDSYFVHLLHKKSVVRIEYYQRQSAANNSWLDDVILPYFYKTYLVLQLFVFASEGHNFVLDDGELLLFLHAAFTRRFSVLHQSKRTRKQCQQFEDG